MDNSYEIFKKQVKELTTIDLNAYKEKQMKRRIDTLIGKHNMQTYSDFISLLKRDNKIYQEFVNYLTINVSEFFRNIEQWHVLENEIFPSLIKTFGSKLKIWSAACSTGDEPYSLVMALSSQIPINQINIIATDIDGQVLEKAQAGIFTEKSILSVPEQYKKKFFIKDGNNFRISDEIKKQVTFKKHDLLKDSYPDNCHLIVCRNVLIYFTEEAKNDIYHKFNKALINNGILFIGSTEQIVQYREFNFQRHSAFFYEKPK